MQRGDVPPAILQSDIFHTLTSQYGYRTMSYFDSRQFYRNIIHHYFLQCSLGQKTHQYRNICLQLGWHFVLPKVAERIPCSKKYGWLPKLEEAPPPYSAIASTGALSSKRLIHGVVISQHCHSKPFLTTNASKTRKKIVTLCLKKERKWNNIKKRINVNVFHESSIAVHFLCQAPKIPHAFSCGSSRYMKISKSKYRECIWVFSCLYLGCAHSNDFAMLGWFCPCSRTDHNQILCFLCDFSCGF